MNEIVNQEDGINRDGAVNGTPNPPYLPPGFVPIERQSPLAGRSLFRRVRQAALLAVAAGVGAWAAPANAQTPFEENVLPAAYSFDETLGLLGLDFGIDPSYPVLTATGNIDNNGFNWTCSGLYNGLTVGWSASGVYDAGTSSTTWNGSGSYDGQAWAMSGVSEWLSPTAFQIQDGISIDGQSIIYSSDSSGNPAWNLGTFTDPTTTITYTEVSSSHWYNPFSWGSVDGLVVAITTDGSIASDTYTETKNPTTGGGGGVKIGPAAGGGGFISYGGGTYQKSTQITSIPEPSTLALACIGAFSLLACGWRRRTARA